LKSLKEQRDQTIIVLSIGITIGQLKIALRRGLKLVKVSNLFCARDVYPTLSDINELAEADHIWGFIVGGIRSLDMFGKKTCNHHPQKRRKA